MPRKYSFTLSEDDFRKQIQPIQAADIPKTQLTTLYEDQSVISELMKKDAEKQKVKDELRKNRKLSSATSNPDISQPEILHHIDHSIQNNPVDFNKTIRPVNKLQDNSYKRFSDTRYFNWDDSGDEILTNERSTSFTREQAYQSTIEVRPCVLCQLALEASEKEKAEENRRKIEMRKKTYRSEHCIELDRFQKQFK